MVWKYLCNLPKVLSAMKLVALKQRGFFTPLLPGELGNVW